MRRVAPVLALLWTLLFLACAAWLNDIPRKRMFESITLDGRVAYGIPLETGAVAFRFDAFDDAKPTRFLHRNLDKFDLRQPLRLAGNIVIVLGLALFNGWGLWRVTRDSWVVAGLCGLAWGGLAAIIVYFGLPALRFPALAELTLLDEIAMLTCVLWLAFALVSAQQLLEAVAYRVVPQQDRDR